MVRRDEVAEAVATRLDEGESIAEGQRRSWPETTSQVLPLGDVIEPVFCNAASLTLRRVHERTAYVTASMTFPLGIDCAQVARRNGRSGAYQLCGIWTVSRR